MDNEVIIQIGEVEYHFKLKSQKIVELEKLLGKNIFDIFSDMSFTSLRLILSKCCLAPENADPDKVYVKRTAAVVRRKKRASKNHKTKNKRKSK